MPSPIQRHVGQVFIPVRDMKRAARWYAELLGLEHREGRLGHDDTIFDIPTDGGPGLCLDANRPDFVDSGPARFFFWTDDLEATLQHLHTMAAADVAGPVDVGSLSFVTFRDPDDNLLMVARPNG